MPAYQSVTYRDSDFANKAFDLSKLLSELKQAGVEPALSQLSVDTDKGSHLVSLCFAGNLDADVVTKVEAVVAAHRVPTKQGD